MLAEDDIKAVEDVYNKYKDLEDDPSIPQFIRSNLKALKSIAGSKKHRGSEHDQDF
jgi:hypothetical protein